MTKMVRVTYTLAIYYDPDDQKNMSLSYYKELIIEGFHRLLGDQKGFQAIGAEIRTIQQVDNND